VDITPTDVGFSKIMTMFLDQILDTTFVRSQKTTAILLSSVLDIARYMSQKNPTEFNKIVKYLDDLGHEPK
jgi:hypothetical protein